MFVFGSSQSDLLLSFVRTPMSLMFEVQNEYSFAVILLHEKSGRTFCPKTRKTFRTFSKNLGQNSCQSNFHSTGC